MHRVGAAWPIDMRGQPCGLYHLSAEDTVLLDFYLSERLAVRHWGLVEIFAKDTSVALTFTISLASRETVWRYYIVNKSHVGSPYDSYEVVGERRRSGAGDNSGNGDIRFTKRSETVMLDGLPAVVFESQQAIAFLERPTEDDYFFMFRANGQGERAGRPVKLPFAQPASTAINTADGETGIMLRNFCLFVAAK